MEMTREEAIKNYIMPALKRTWNDDRCIEIISALEQVSCENAINRQDVLDLAKKGVLVSNGNYKSVCKAINELPPVTPQPKIEIGHCRDCMWWRDSDGVYRRGVGAESLCPINNREVFKGNGYCFMFDPQESEK